MSVTAKQHYTFDGVTYRPGDEIPEGVAQEHGLADREGSDDGLKDIEFASSAAENLAAEAGLETSEFSGAEPSGETGYTKPDVEELTE